MVLLQEEDKLTCFLWQRSYFYNKAQFATNGWHLRYFTFGTDYIRSVPDKKFATVHRINYIGLTDVEVDANRLIIRLISGPRDFYLMAPNMKVFEAVEDKVEFILEKLASNPSLRHQDSLEDVEFSIHQEESMVHYPASGSGVAKFFFICLFPFRFLMHWTVPDVRVLDIHGNPTSSMGLSPLMNSYLAIIGCLIWLIVGSYAMVASLENLADLMHIPAAVVGVTVSAVGTSLPNYVASKVAAESGFGVSTLKF